MNYSGDRLVITNQLIRANEPLSSSDIWFSPRCRAGRRELVIWICGLIFRGRPALSRRQFPSRDPPAPLTACAGRGGANMPVTSRRNQATRLVGSIGCAWEIDPQPPADRSWPSNEAPGSAARPVGRTGTQREGRAATAWACPYSAHCAPRRLVALCGILRECSHRLISLLLARPLEVASYKAALKRRRSPPSTLVTP